MKNQQKRLISVREAAQLTGMSSTWWRAAIAGRKQLPPVRVVRLGGAIRIHLGDLMRFIEEAPMPKVKRKPGRPKKSESIKKNF